MFFGFFSTNNSDVCLRHHFSAMKVSLSFNGLIPVYNRDTADAEFSPEQQLGGRPKGKGKTDRMGNLG